MSRYTVEEFGSKYSTTYCAYIYDEVIGTVVSPLNDIPAFCDEKAYTVNMVVEIPRWTNAKFEISTKAELNPITQDVKKALPRFVHNIFPSYGYMWNYGAIPQTWEDPAQVDQHTGAKGDNDPVDIIEIGAKVLRTGDVVPVKVIGCIALIDEGETDWKIIAIDTTDERAFRINSLDDLKYHFPSLLEETIQWFRYYKVPAGSGVNKFAFEGTYIKDRDFSMNVIKGAYNSWRTLVSSSSSPLSRLGTSDQSYRHYVNKERVQSILSKCPPKEADTPIPEDAQKVYYVAKAPLQ